MYRYIPLYRYVYLYKGMIKEEIILALKMVRKTLFKTVGRRDTVMRGEIRLNSQ